MTSDDAAPSLRAVAISRVADDWRTWLLWLAMSGLFFFLVSLFLPVAICCGQVDRSVSVVVVDGNSGSPVKNAEVLVMQKWGGYSEDSLAALGRQLWLEALRERNMLGNADGKGMVQLRIPCGAGWTPTIFGGKKGKYSLGHILEVSHPGYEPVRVTLASLVGGDRFPLSKKELAVKVWLIPKTSSH